MKFEIPRVGSISTQQEHAASNKKRDSSNLYKKGHGLAAKPQTEDWFIRYTSAARLLCTSN